MQISAYSIKDSVLPWSPKRPLAVKSGIEEWVLCKDELTWADLPGREEINDVLLPLLQLHFRGQSWSPGSVSLCPSHAEHSNEDNCAEGPHNWSLLCARKIQQP